MRATFSPGYYDVRRVMDARPAFPPGPRYPLHTPDSSSKIWVRNRWGVFSYTPPMSLFPDALTPAQRWRGFKHPENIQQVGKGELPEWDLGPVFTLPFCSSSLRQLCSL